MTRFVLLVFLLSNIALAKGELKESEISQRTGHELDSYERGYFRLFNDAKGYRSAEFFTDDDSNTVVKIYFTEGHTNPDSTFTIKKEIAKQIRFYIENYELLNTEDYSGYKFDQAVWTYIKPGTRYYRNSIKWFDLNRIEHIGTLLHIDSTFIVVQKNDDDFNWIQANDSTYIVFFNQILAINSHPVLKNAYKFGEVIREIKGTSSFINYYKDDFTLPKELVDLINERRNVFTVKEIESKPEAAPDIVTNVNESRRSLGLKIGRPVFFSNRSFTVKTSSNINVIEDRSNIEVGFPNMNACFYFENSLWKKRHFAGAELLYSPETSLNNVDLKLTSIGFKLYYKYYNKIYTGYETSIFNNISISYSLGLSYLSMNLINKIRSPFYEDDYGGKPFDINAETSAFGLNGTLGSYFNFNEYFGFFFEADMFYTPGSYEPMSALKWDRYGRYYWQEIKGSAIKFSSFDVRFGLNLNISGINSTDSD